MDFEDAIQTAQHAAKIYGNRLGRCLFEFPPLRSSSCWIMCFEIIEGPPDWSWLVIINESGDVVEFLAVQQKPSKEVIPKIRRRWLFGRRYVRLPYSSS